MTPEHAVVSFSGPNSVVRSKLRYNVEGVSSFSNVYGLRLNARANCREERTDNRVYLRIASSTFLADEGKSHPYEELMSD